MLTYDALYKCKATLTKTAFEIKIFCVELMSNMTFKMRGPFKKHQLKDHLIKIECEICANIFFDFKTYQNHRKTHLSFICIDCGEDRDGTVS